jgi:excinuclease ABC subunit C
MEQNSPGTQHDPSSARPGFTELKKQAREAPLDAGVYLMRDKAGDIIYVGKAKILRNRLASYFSGEKDIKTTILVRQAASIETIITPGEYEALLLENTLIKQHSPKYNLKLTDGKTYPVIRLSSGPYPRVFRTRHIVEDGSSYFGPYPNVGAVDDLLTIIDRNFPLRKCRVLRKRTSPCIYYHIGRCAAPCCGRISEAGYELQTGRVRRLLSGETASVSAELEEAMKTEAAALRFERAAALRNAIRAIAELSGASAVVDFDRQGRDYIAWAAEGVLATWSVFSMRGGKLTGRDLFRTRSASGDEESLQTFISNYYNGERPPPPKIFIGEPQNEPRNESRNEDHREQGGGKPPPCLHPSRTADAGAPDRPMKGSGTPLYAPRPADGESSYTEEGLNHIRRWFREEFGAESEIVVCGVSGENKAGRHHAAIIAMVRQNAAEDLARRLRERGAGPALDELAAALNLRGRPETIEGFDIAQLDGKHPVASLISFRNGVPDRKNYRRFKLRSVIGIVDDFASMREAVRRRYSRLLRENRELPDLVLIDGGIGQVNAAKGVLDELGLDCGIVGLAKREEELWLPGAGKPVVLSRRSEALKVLQHVRDETHRFATALNQKLRSKELKLEALESIEGIGPARAAALIKAFGSIGGIAAASPTDIAAACGISLAAASSVRAVAKLTASRRAAPFTGNRALRSGSLAGKSLAAAALADKALAGKDLDGAEGRGSAPDKTAADKAAEPEQEYR